jgi:aspartate kinase
MYLVHKSTGTRIVSQQLFNSVIKAIAFRKNITVINIHSNRMLGAYGFLSEVFEIFKKYETSVDLITTSEVSISLTIDDIYNLDNILQDLNKFSKTEVYHGRSIISAVGEGIRHTAGIAARFFGVLKGINVSMVSLGASEVNLGVVVNDEDLERAVKLLHEEFFNENCSKEIFEDIN